MVDTTEFKEKSATVKTKIDELTKTEGLVLTSMKEKSGEDLIKLKIHLQDLNLNIASYYIVLTDLQFQLTNTRNDTHLNEAKKCVYKSIMIFEEILTSYIDVPYSDYEENLAQLSWMSDESKYKAVLKLGFCIDSLIFAYGENSKFKWTLMELKSKLAVICKNIIDFKKFVVNNDSRVEGYEARHGLVNLAKKLLQEAADINRQKYELSTQAITDFNLSIKYLLALKNVYHYVGDVFNSEELKKKADIWKQKLDEDLKLLDKKNKGK